MIPCHENGSLKLKQKHSKVSGQANGHWLEKLDACWISRWRKSHCSFLKPDENYRRQQSLSTGLPHLDSGPHRG